MGVVVSIVLLLIVIVWALSRYQRPPSKYYGVDLWFDRQGMRPSDWVAKNKTILNNAHGLFKPLADKGYDIKAVKSIITLETGHLSDVNAKTFVVTNNNLLGIEASSNKPRYFQTCNDCIAYFDYIVSILSRYKLAFDNRGDGVEFLRQLQLGGYNPNIDWFLNTRDIYKQW